MPVGPTIRKIRQSRGLTLDEVASALGVKRQAVSKWELGHNDLPVSRLEELGGVLGFDVQLDARGTSAEKAELLRLVQLADEPSIVVLLGLARHIVKEL
jgi:transcriptional regulator with XRE-family HTH domain